jgi:hypothetical protein
MVYTPGGVRCRDCAQLRRPVMYELAVAHYIRAGAVAAVLGVGFGLVGALLLPPDSRVPFFGLILALLAGSGAGTLMAEALTRATRGKRGVEMQSIAVAGLLLASVVRLAVSGEFAQVTSDLIGLFALAIAVAVVWSRLR